VVGHRAHVSAEQLGIDTEIIIPARSNHAVGKMTPQCIKRGSKCCARARLIYFRPECGKDGVTAVPGSRLRKRKVCEKRDMLWLSEQCIDLTSICIGESNAAKQPECEHWKSAGHCTGR